MTEPGHVFPSTRPHQGHLYDLDADVTVTFTCAEAEHLRYGIHLARIAQLRKILADGETIVESQQVLVELYQASRKLGAPPEADWEHAVRRYQPLPARRSA